MYLFKPIEFEIKTGWTKQVLIQKLKEKANFKKDEFTIDPYFFPPTNLLSLIKGEVRTTKEWVILSYKIYPSRILNLLTIFWLGGVSIAMISAIVDGLSDWEYNHGITVTLIMWFLVFLISQLSFISSVDFRERLIRQMLKELRNNP